MVDLSWFGVAGVLCLLLGILVWGAQRVLNTFHPWGAFRQVYRSSLAIPVRLGLLIVLWLGVATVLAALVLSYVLSLPAGTQALSPLTLDRTLRIAMLGSGVLIFGASFLCMIHWSLRTRKRRKKYDLYDRSYIATDRLPGRR